MNPRKKLGIIDYPEYTPYILLAIFILLASLIPGGPIETRDFSHLEPAVVWIFNGFLTILGFGSLILVYFLIIKKKLAYKISILVGLIYSILAILDLLKIFPKSPTPAPALLSTFEVIILVLSISLILFSYKSLSNWRFVNENETRIILPKRFWIIVLLIITLLSIMAVIYASLSILQ